MRRTLGCLFIGVGAAIAGLAGIATLLLVLGGLADPGSGPEDAGYLPMVIVFGGVTVAAGLGLCYIGKRLRQTSGSDTIGQ